MRAGLGQFFTHTALVIFRNYCPFCLVTLVQEREAEGEAEIIKDPRIFRPHQHGAGRHDDRNVTIHEALTGQIGNRNHIGDRHAIKI